MSSVKKENPVAATPGKEVYKKRSQFGSIYHLLNIHTETKKVS